MERNRNCRIMTKLTIITINRNNAAGLERTLRSVAGQSCRDFEYIVIDGASTDGSVEVIQRFAPVFGDRLKWVSEPDTGIYNAQNKGIRMASGQYLEFLNSGDCLASDDVVERMLAALDKEGSPAILYGNMLKEMTDGKLRRDKSFAGREITMLGMYTGTLNHSPAYIRHDLFDRFGLYDETLKIVSDWKWYTEAIIIGGQIPVYTDIDVTRFDMTGISETNKDLDKAERKKVLEDLFPKAVLSDYERYAYAMKQFDRLKRYPWAYKIVWFLERCLFKKEKREINRRTLIR